MKEELKNTAVGYVNLEEVNKNLTIKVERLQQKLDDAENEMVRMEKYFKHVYYMLVLEAMIGMSIIGFVGAYLITTK